MYKKKIILIFVLNRVLFANPVDLFTTGVSSWMVIDRKPSYIEGIRRNYYFNKLYLNSYLKFGSINAYIGAPLQLVVQRDKFGKVKSGFAPGNLNFWFGKKIKIIEPRIGLTFPLFYRKEKIWFGSGDIKLQMGTGFNADIRYESKFAFSGELMAKVTIVDWNKSSRIKKAHSENGSLIFLPSIKFRYSPKNNVKIGIEVLGSFSRMLWVWNPDGEVELSAGIVPNLYTEIFVGEKLAISAKGGVGPSFRKEYNEESFNRVGTSINISAGINIYP